MTRDTGIFDVVILGAGPGGMSAALWCCELGLSTRLLERAAEPGGQLLSIYNPVDNYIGLRAADGRQVRDRFVESISGIEDRFTFGANVRDISVGSRSLTLDSGEKYRFRSLIIATGVSRRKLGVRGENEFVGKGILVSGKRDAAKVRDNTVVVVGGGDAAIENALILAEAARLVFVVHRRAEFTARQEFLNAAKNTPNIRFLPAAIVTALIGDERLTAVQVRSETGEQLIETDHLIVRIGSEPNSKLAVGQLEMDERGYINVDSQCRTNFVGIYAVGDVANPVSPTISSAAGMGATAAKHVFDWLNHQKSV